MARLISITYLPANASLFLNSSNGGAAPNINLAVNLPYVFLNTARSLTFYSPDDLSGTDFIIRGTDQFGNFQTETLTGGNNEEVVSQYLYHTITSIGCNNPYTNLSIGMGGKGCTLWIKLNTLVLYAPTSVAVEVAGGGAEAVLYNINKTFDSLENYVQSGASIKYVHPGAPFLLGNDPLSTTLDSNIVSVFVPSTAPLYNGEIITIDGATDTNGITADELNVRSMITIVDSTHFTYAASNNATSTGTGGGNNVTYTAPAPPFSFFIAENQTDSTVVMDIMPAIQVVVEQALFGSGLQINILQNGVP